MGFSDLFGKTNKANERLKTRQLYTFFKPLSTYMNTCKREKLKKHEKGGFLNLK